MSENPPNHKPIDLIQYESELIPLFERFIKRQTHVRKNRPATLKGYRDNFKLLLQFKGDIALKDLTEETMVDFFEHLDTRERMVGKEQIVRKYKNSSVETVRGKLNTFFKYLLDDDRNNFIVNPFKNLPHATVSYTDKKAYMGHEFDAICNAINTKIKWFSLFVKKRNIAIIMFFVFTGVRREELIALQLSDVDIKNKSVNIRSDTSKALKARNIPLAGELIPYLVDYLESRSNYQSQAFWVSSTKDFPFTVHGIKHLIDEKLKPATGIEVTCHRFRHTFAVNFYRQSSGDMWALHKLLGHREYKMTVTYLRSLAPEEISAKMENFTIDKFI